MDKELLTVRDVCERLGVTRPTLMKMRKAKSLPRPVIRISARKVYWRLADIERFLGAQEAANK